ncbi:MAG: leucine-rich repeat domain-containing protein [Bacillota bacterium]
MYRKIAVFTVGVLIMLTVTLGGCGPRVTFSDPGLAQAVAQHLGAQVDSLRAAAVAEITELNASNCGIVSVDGIAALKSLEAINLAGNQLTDIRPLVDADLPNLKQVRIADNPLPVGLDSAVYSEIKTLRQRGISVEWLPSFVAPMGHYSYITDMVQAPDGSLVAINEGRLFHVNLLGKDAWSDGSPGPAYSMLANIVRADGLVLGNSPALDEYGPWEYSFRSWGELDSNQQFHYPNGVYRMTLTPDGGYLLVGRPHWQGDSAKVVKVDANNNEIWSGSYREQGSGMSGIAIPNGYVILCEKGLIQLDSEGKKVKTLDFASHGVEKARSPKIVQTQDGYAIMGFPAGHQEKTALVTFTADLAVNKVVQIPVPNGPDDYSMVYDFDATDDGGFVLAVHNWAFPETSADGLLVKIDTAGKILWSRSYKDYALGFVIQTADGGFAVGAYDKDWMTFIIKTDGNGSVDGQ